MRRRSLWILAVLIGLPAASPPRGRAETITIPAPAEDPRLERVLVFPGGGFQFAMFLGMLDGLASQGERPDVVIGTCGGSVAAAIATTIPSSADRLAFLESVEFFRVLRGASLQNGGLASVLARLWRLSRAGSSADGVPDLFGDTLLSLPPRVPANELERPFASSGIRAVILAGRAGFQPAEVGRPRDGRKLYRQVFFTDPGTAALLAGLQSPIARRFPDSAVELETAVIRDRPPSVAARVGITDPFYVNPVRLDDGHYYLTGAIDLYPLETARHLGKKVYMPFPSGFKSFVERKAIQATFGYDNNERLREVTSGSVARWIDISDAEHMYDQHGFDPQFHLWSLSARARVPASYDEYRRRIRAQWEYGRQRALQAVGQPPQSQTHIRVMDDNNTSREARCRLGREDCQEPFHQEART